MASSEKRAETSAMRPEPLVMTTKFTITRIANTIRPITKLPCMMKPPNASITCPAAAGPSWPSARISRVEARFSASRSRVAISSTAGNELNSSGRTMNSAVSSTSTEKVIDSASSRSSSSGGIGRISTTRMPIMPSASAMSPWRSVWPRRPSRSPGARLRFAATEPMSPASGAAHRGVGPPAPGGGTATPSSPY